MNPIISFGGLASGLDSAAIISALVAFRARPIDVLAKRQAEFQSLKTRYAALKAKVDTLQDAADDIQTATGFLAFKASSSNQNVLTATADGTAGAGSYTFKVNQTAKAEIKASTGYANFDTAIADSATTNQSIDITYGGDLTKVNIDAGATLEDIKDAINNAGIGVTASIINTGVGATPYQLVVTGDDTGADNTIVIDDSNLTYEPTVAALGFTTKQGAENSQIEFGGITFERATNTIDDVVNGLTLNVLTEPGTEVTVTVSPDTAAIQEKIQTYVNAHNDVISFINAEIAISAVTDQAGAFNGESTVRKLKDKLLGLHGVDDYPGAQNPTLASVGIELNSDGTLLFNKGDFEDALNDNLSSVTSALTKVGDFFDKGGFQVVNTGDLKAGTYEVKITQAATKASATAGALFAGAAGTPLAQDENLTINVGDGDPITVELKAGMTVTEAIKEINAALNDADAGLHVSDDGGSLKFLADDYGSAFDFTVTSDVASGGSGIGSALSGSGIDVKGTIDGEAATGTGQLLVGADDTDVEGVEIKYTGSDDTLTTNLTVGPDGFFQRVNDVLQSFLAPIEGSLDLRIKGLETSIGDMDDRIESMTDRLEQYESLLQTRFANLESVIAGLQAQQAFLTLSQAQLFGNGGNQS